MKKTLTICFPTICVFDETKYDLKFQQQVFNKLVKNGENKITDFYKSTYNISSEIDYIDKNIMNENEYYIYNLEGFDTEIYNYKILRINIPDKNSFYYEQT